MSTIGTKRPNTWLNMAAIALFLMIGIACVNTTDIEPILGEPGADNTSDSFVVTSMGSSEGSVSNGVIAQSSFIPTGPTAFRASSTRSLSADQLGASNAGIWVTGEATLEIPADIANVSIGVEVREESVTDARQKAATTMGKVVKTIGDQGVKTDDIVTTQFSIYPQTIWVEVSDSLGLHSEPRIVGYTVNNTVQVTVRDIDKLSAIIDNAASTGGDLIRVNSIQFTVDDPTVFSKKIREIAAADAIAKADVYAQAMGVTLGQLVYLAELGNSAPMSGNYDMAMRSAPMMAESFAPSPISGGDVNISVTVQAMFAIAD